MCASLLTIILTALTAATRVYSFKGLACSGWRQSRRQICSPAQEEVGVPGMFPDFPSCLRRVGQAFSVPVRRELSTGLDMGSVKAARRKRGKSKKG